MLYVGVLLVCGILCVRERDFSNLCEHLIQKIAQRATLQRNTFEERSNSYLIYNCCSIFHLKFAGYIFAGTTTIIITWRRSIYLVLCIVIIVWISQQEYWYFHWISSESASHYNIGSQREGQEEEDICGLWLIHADVWQKPTQHCKVIILQLKINFKNYALLEYL